ncbi:chromatin assembly factor 1 subunit B-like [Babylonia areolata]|uniref:chromatin assembly factor 1 subunit B-like n=1 Tax=Babylonia areolata TaxID=304850 RepID=UPI003FD5D8C2
MKVITPEISWHGREPIFSIDLQPCSGNFQRMASCSVEKAVRMWRVRVNEDKVDIDFLASLNRHTATVNVCRFSPDGNYLATAGDDTVVLLWKLNEVTPAVNIFNDDDEENKETWVVHKSLRGHLGDVYDLSWSPDSRYIVSGSVDNTAIAWDTHKDQKLALFSEHKNYVLGVAWDPLREFVATLSSDRSCRIFNLSTKHCIHNISKIVSPHAASSAPPGSKPKASRIFHDDTLQTFFRRLTFSPDGQLLITPAGLMETGEKQVSATFVFTRGSFKEPAAYLPSPNKATLAVRACPCLFELRRVPKDSDGGGPVSESAKEWEKYSTAFCLPYRVVFAVATEDAVVLYDSQQTMPFAYLTNIHYHTLSDLSWSKDGRILAVASTDGYCTAITFEAGELGAPYTPHPAAAESSTMTTETQQACGDKVAVQKKKPTPGAPPRPQTSAQTSSAEKMEVDGAGEAPSSRPNPSETSSTKPPPSHSPATKPAASQDALASSVGMVSISPAAETESCAETEKKPGTAAAETQERKKSSTSPTQSGAKQPKRIQFTTLSLNKK